MLADFTLRTANCLAVAPDCDLGEGEWQTEAVSGLRFRKLTPEQLQRVRASAQAASKPRRSGPLTEQLDKLLSLIAQLRDRTAALGLSQRPVPLGPLAADLERRFGAPDEPRDLLAAARSNKPTNVLTRDLERRLAQKTVEG